MSSCVIGKPIDEQKPCVALGYEILSIDEQKQDLPMVEYINGIVASRKLSDELSSYLVRKVMKIARMCLEIKSGTKLYNLDYGWNETKEELLLSICQECGITVEKSESSSGWNVKFSNQQSEQNAINRMSDSVKQISQKYKRMMNDAKNDVIRCQEVLADIQADYDTFRERIQV